MPFTRILQEITSFKGVESAVFVDSQGEAISWCGRGGKDKLHLLGAYQGIVLSSIARLGIGNSSVVTLCKKRSILTRHIKDGYFVCVVLLASIHFAEAHFHLQQHFDLLEKEL